MDIARGRGCGTPPTPNGAAGARASTAARRARGRVCPRPRPRDAREARVDGRVQRAVVGRCVARGGGGRRSGVAAARRSPPGRRGARPTRSPLNRRRRAPRGHGARGGDAVGGGSGGGGGWVGHPRAGRARGDKKAGGFVDGVRLAGGETVGGAPTHPRGGRKVVGSGGEGSAGAALPWDGRAEGFAVWPPPRASFAGLAEADSHRHCSRGASDGPHTAASATARVVEKEFCSGGGGRRGRAGRVGSCSRRGGGSAGQPGARLRQRAGEHRSIHRPRCRLICEPRGGVVRRGT